MQEGLKYAVKVQMDTAKTSYEIFDLAKKAAEHGKTDAVSDALVSAQMAYSGVISGIANVKINLGDVEDGEFIDEMLDECERLKNESKDKLDRVIEISEERLKINK